jgi:hypothetical protein
MTAEDMAHLNFMKKQQWNVAYYAILLLAAVFAVKKEFDPLDFVERQLGTVLSALVLLLGILLLCFIQSDIGGHRRRIGSDADAYSRGSRVYDPPWAEHILCLLHCCVGTLAGLFMLGTIARGGAGR